MKINININFELFFKFEKLYENNIGIKQKIKIGTYSSDALSLVIEARNTTNKMTPILRYRLLLSLIPDLQRLIANKKDVHTKSPETLVK